MFERDGDDAIVTFQESAGILCFRHVISQVFIRERKPAIIDITLELESTSDACVECLGLIESRIRVGPVALPKRIRDTKTKLNNEQSRSGINHRPDNLLGRQPVRRTNPLPDS